MSSARRIKAIIFDMDGLMVDTEPIYWAAARELAAQRGKTVADATLRRMMGRARLDSISILMQEVGIADMALHEFADERDRLVLQHLAGVEPMSGLLETLRQFHNRLKLGVATSALRKFTEIILPSLGIEQLFAAVQTGDEIVNGKPNPEIYLKAIAQLGAEPAECVVLEDSRAGAMAGKNAEAFTIAIPSPLTAGDDFSFAAARVENLREAAAKIEELLG